ncbi:MAG TPA: hypothetical protein VL173_10460 [Vicinamibacterales bacterium]|jgi:hypothetical protein|nr:hypothetical protein [Vicinamibacterales bacterium]
MSAMPCAREHDVMTLVLSGRWPESADASLVTHAETCATCAEVVAIASMLRVEKDQLNQLSIPAAGQVWWRSALRARADAARAAERPMIWLQAVTGAGAVGAVLAGLTMLWPRLAGTVHLVLTSNGASMQEVLPLLLIAGIGIVAAPIAFYLAVPKD